MKTVIHIPSWYPNNNNKVAGIFSQKLIKAISETNTKEFHHIVLLWHDNKFATIKQPIHFLKTVANYIFRPRKTVNTLGNITVIKFNIFQGNESLFGSNDQRIISTLLDYLAKHNSYSLIHAQVSYIGGHIASKASKLFNAKYIITEHMGPYAYNQLNKNTKNKIKTAISNASAMVPVSFDQSDFFKKEVHFKTNVIPNVVDDSEFSRFKERNTITDCISFITVGILSPVKGINNLLDALKTVINSTDKTVKLKICGDGPILKELIAYSHSINVYNNIEWIGNISRGDIINNLLNSNIYVCSSIRESFGVAPVEAMACGLPIVSTNCGGPSDYINSTTGLMAEGIDSISLANKMIEMLKNFDHYNPQDIRAYYLANFSNKTIGRQYINLYNDVLHENTKS